jgi:prepilin-type N-terminal cleavage/methylation domain-containing protein
VIAITHPKFPRRGLTLMELIVVIAILVALAGVLIPLFPSMIGRAHTSTGATNDGETAKAVQIYEATYFNYPNQFDSLMGTGGTALFTKLPGGGTVGGVTELTTATLTADTAAALTNAGINAVWDLDDATADPTFNPYGAIRTIADTGTVVVLGTDAKQRMNLPAAETFVVLGLGRKCTMIGTTITDPPVHFADDQENTPDKVYGRKGLVFLITKNGGTAAREKAKFVTTVSFHADQVVSSDDHLKEYYGLVNDN